MVWKRPRQFPGWLFVALSALWLALPGTLRAVDAPPLPEGLRAPSQPTAMPEFELPDVQGTTVNATAFQGKVVVVRFWATW